MSLYFQWDCISPQQQIISENFLLLRIFRGEILPLKLHGFDADDLNTVNF